MTLAVVSFVVLSTLALANLGRQLTSADQLEPDQCRPEEDPTCSAEAHNLAIESLFGQLTKTVVYGGAAVAQLNSRMLCKVLAHEMDRGNVNQPTLYLFGSPHAKDKAFKIYADDEVTPEMLEEAKFDPEQPTILFVHGWLGGLQNELWLSAAKDAALRASSDLFDSKPLASSLPPSYRPNVIVVDWSELAQGSLYTATQNSYRVSSRLGRLLGQMARAGELRPELMHCLGHSIGAHICGRAARQAFPAEPQPAGSGLELSNRRRFGRITALDPGGFCYELGIRNESAYAGLRPSDALLVDAYYSNRSPFGNRFQVAHYNVRLDNGLLQRPCSVWRNPSLATDYFRAAVRFALGSIGHNDVLTCDHYFGTRFAGQLPPATCSYVGYACDSYKSFLRGRCGRCESPADCYAMDFEYQRANASSHHFLDHIRRHSSLLSAQFNQLDPDSPPGGVPYEQRGAYYMRVAGREPYCSFTYRVRVVLDPGVVDVRSFRASSIQLQLAGIVTLLNSASGKLSSGIPTLYGPWLDSTAAERNFGLDNRTLSGLFELRRAQRIRGLLVLYDNDLGRSRPRPAVNPIESIHIDYLSAADNETRRLFSSSFQGDQIEVQFRRQVEAASEL